MSEPEEEFNLSEQMVDVFSALFKVGMIIGTVLMAAAFIKEFSYWIQLR